MTAFMSKEIPRPPRPSRERFSSLTGRSRRRLVLGCSVLFAVMPLIAATPAQADDLIEENQYLRTTIDGQTVRLQVVITKRADLQGRLPIALVNHGRPPHAYQEFDLGLSLPDPTIVEARDMAYRGWLAVAVRRRGYGSSDGATQADRSCGEGFFGLINKDADDVQAALAVIAQRPDADPTRVISMGVSAGGAASVALAARNKPGLVAIISVAGGGEPIDSACYVAASVPVDYKEFGSRTRIPSLWVFAKNDPKHPPEQVKVMQKAFTEGGAKLKLVELEPLGDNGHEMMGSPLGRSKWLAELDSFLRGLGLPTWQPSDVDALLRRLKWKAAGRSYLESYMSAATEKALARSKKTDYATFEVADTLEGARAAALKACEEKAPPCYIAMENFRWVGP